MKIGEPFLSHVVAFALKNDILSGRNLIKNLLNQIRKCCTHKDSHVLIKISGYDDYNGDSRYWMNFSLDCYIDHETIVEGRGSTPDEAMKNLISQIEDKTIRFYELYNGHFFDVEVAKELKIGS